MSYEMKEGEITLFKNTKEGENLPYLRGKALIDGVERDVALWLKQGQNQKYFSGRVTVRTEPLQKPHVGGTPFEKPAPVVAKQDEDLPF